MKKVMVVLLVVVLALSVAGCYHIPEPRLTLLSHTWTREYDESLDRWRVEITGVAVNSGPRRISYVQLRSRTYAEGHIFIGGTSTNTSGLNENEIWYFLMLLYVPEYPVWHLVWVGDISH